MKYLFLFITLLSLSGCGSTNWAVSRAVDSIDQYCDSFSYEQRHMFREYVNNKSSNEIYIVCENDDNEPVFDSRETK